MDGWESRRKRTPGHDWCVVRLGVPGRVAGFEIDTRHFTGNYSAAEIFVLPKRPGGSGRASGLDEGHERLALNGDDRVYVAVEHEEPVTHVRLDIFPDGGVARLRVWGRVAKDWSTADADAPLDLLAMENGGRGIIANDEHYGCIEKSDRARPRRRHGRRLGDAAAARARARLGGAGAGRSGAHRGGRRRHGAFQRQLSDRCFLQAAPAATGTPEEIAAASEGWPPALEVKLEAEGPRLSERARRSRRRPPGAAGTSFPTASQPAAAGRSVRKGRRMTSLSTHVLDTMHGRPAAGLKVALSGPDGEISRERDQHRRPLPRSGAGRAEPGRYALRFSVADYYRGLGVALPDPPFLDEVTVDFGISPDGGHYTCRCSSRLMPIRPTGAADRWGLDRRMAQSRLEMAVPDRGHRLDRVESISSGSTTI